MPNWGELDIPGWRAAVAERGAAAGVEYALRRIAETQELNAFTVVLDTAARERAAQLDALPAVERGVLHGVPLALKDENDLAGTVTSFGTSANTTPKTANSLFVDRLLAAGAIIIGKTTMPAFGAFSITESEAFGVTRNPHNLRRTPGGSSGGSAAAVAAGIVPAAIGGDGGGSIRIPADRCGLYGLKPERGSVPTAPYPHLWHELGVAGPLAKTAADALLLCRVMAGVEVAAPAVSDAVAPDAAASQPLPLPAESQSQPLAAQPLPEPPRLRIGVQLRPTSPGVRLARSHRDAVLAAAARLAERGHTVEQVAARLPDPTLPFIVQFFRAIADEIAGLDNPAMIERRHRFTGFVGRLIPERLLAWAKARSASFGADLAAQLGPYDVLLTPTTAGRPRRADSNRGKSALGAMLAATPDVAYTAVWNVAGNAVLAVPYGRATDGLPVSIQLIAVQQERAAEPEAAREITLAAETLLVQLAQELSG
ncbi:amidase family protein [Canibacter oris]|uniref:Amidase n=1 Tax=Canibacter oris TaxID=1365628 RepID=A0A840DP97_9MICO|nr:amidase family protein [Canibacter oris]MBB4071369.1 amidase [Canibacter oris]